ncbi:MAG TPA: hypothetical protein VGN16_07695 [Acidobacteriaceae bacterium]
MLARVLRLATVVSIAVALLWVILIVAPMWLTRWRMSRLLADYHSIYPTQSSWEDAQKLMARWGKWGRYEGTCTFRDCDYSIRVGDEYSNWVDKLSERNRERIDILLLTAQRHLGYRWSALQVHFQVQDGRIVRTRTMFLLSVADAGPPEYWQYTLGVSAQVRSRLASNYDESPSVEGVDEQLALHPDYKVGRPGGCEGCEIDNITYAPTLPHDEAVRLTDFNLSCLTRLRACTTIGDLLPYGSGWHLYEELPSNLYPTSNGGPLPCRTEPRALARDAVAVLEIEVLVALPDFKPDTNAEHPQELVRARILHAWKKPLRDLPGSTVKVAPFAEEAANPPYWPTSMPEHLLPGHRALIFLTEDAVTDFSADPQKTGIVAYPLGRCGVIEDSPANLAAVQLGIAQDIPYRHPLRDTSW